MIAFVNFLSLEFRSIHYVLKTSSYLFHIKSQIRNKYNSFLLKIISYYLYSYLVSIGSCSLVRIRALITLAMRPRASSVFYLSFNEIGSLLVQISRHYAVDIHYKIYFS